MSKNLGWRGAIIGIVVLLALLYLTPTLTKGNLPGWWLSIFPQEQINLGLDLQGGMHLVYEVEVLKAVENDLNRNIEDIKDDLRSEKIRYLELRRDRTEGIQVTIMREEDREAFKEMVESRYPDFDVNGPISKENGIAFTLVLKPGPKKEIMNMASDQVLETIRNRIDEFGVSEPDIRTQENHRILIQLPGVTDPERAKALIKTTAQLEFKLVDDENSLDEALKGNIPPGREILYEVTKDSTKGNVKTNPLLLIKRSLLTGEYVTDARVTIDPRFNEPHVSINFNNKGARIFERITGENVNKRLAIVLDNNIHSAPNIDEKIGGGKAQIRGRFSMEEARDLALVLRAGALPAPLRILEERMVGPSLGKDSISKGFNSMVMGAIAVILFMMVYYGLSGCIADLALILNTHTARYSWNHSYHRHGSGCQCPYI